MGYLSSQQKLLDLDHERTYDTHPFSLEDRLLSICNLGSVLYQNTKTFKQDPFGYFINNQLDISLLDEE